MDCPQFLKVSAGNDIIETAGCNESLSGSSTPSSLYYNAEKYGLEAQQHIYVDTDNGEDHVAPREPRPDIVPDGDNIGPPVVAVHGRESS